MTQIPAKNQQNGDAVQKRKCIPQSSLIGGALGLLVLLLPQLASAKFVNVKVESVSALNPESKETAYEIRFSEVVKGELDGYRLGDIIELKRTNRLGQYELHKTHFYSLTHFDWSKNSLAITIHPQSRLGYAKLSEKLSKAKPGSTRFWIEVIPMRLPDEFKEGPVVLLAGGWAVTRHLSILRHFEETGFAHPVCLVQSYHTGETPFYSAEIERIAAKLKNVRYVKYETAEGTPHLDKKLEYSKEFYLAQVVRHCSQPGLKTHFLIAGPDANTKRDSEFEAGVSEVLKHVGVEGSQIFTSK